MNKKELLIKCIKESPDCILIDEHGNKFHFKDGAFRHLGSGIGYPMHVADTYEEYIETEEVNFWEQLNKGVCTYHKYMDMLKKQRPDLTVKVPKDK